MAIELSWAGAATDTEDGLALRCRSGDSTAFDELVSRYQLRLFRFAYRMLRDRAEAEDAVQETFVRAYRALPSYRPNGFFSSWIYCIVLNECRRRCGAGRRIDHTIAAETPDERVGEPDVFAAQLDVVASFHVERRRIVVAHRCVVLKDVER